MLSNLYSKTTLNIKKNGRTTAGLTAPPQSGTIVIETTHNNTKNKAADAQLFHNNRTNSNRSPETATFPKQKKKTLPLAIQTQFLFSFAFLDSGAGMFSRWEGAGSEGEESSPGVFYTSSSLPNGSTASYAILKPFPTTVSSVLKRISRASCVEIISPGCEKKFTLANQF